MDRFEAMSVLLAVVEAGSLSAGARRLHAPLATVSRKVGDLEKHLGVRLFNRTTRSLQPTENGRIFYDGARKVLEAIDEAEAAVVDVTQNPRGTIFVAAPLGIGRRFIGPQVPAFKDHYPQIDVRLRLSDRNVDVTAEGLDVQHEAFKVSADMVPAVATGEIHVASGAINPALFNAYTRGVNFTLVADAGSLQPGRANTSLVVRKDLVDNGRYTKLEDLRGMTIGMPGPGWAAPPAR